MADEDKVYAGLAMDRGLAIGNSLDTFSRRALHVKVGNSVTEPIPVFNTAGASGDVVNTFDEVLLVPASTLTTIASYMVPLAKTFLMERISVSGTNIAEYHVYIDGNLYDKAYTWFSGPLSFQFDFTSSVTGPKLVASQVVEIKVKHQRPYDGDFNARIQGVLQ